MKKILGTALFQLLWMIAFCQQVPTPASFLGYELGSRYTPHYQVVNYCKAVAKARPDMVLVQTYGYTNEGRELIALFVSSAANISRLSGIQANNLRLAGMSNDKAMPLIKDAPAIVWLSYNVHGNETSSSEAAMLTLFALTDPTNTQTKQWLNNTLVIIDPCLNPDGRDRYVNWYTQLAGKNYNPDPQSREHNEPWPGGRSNHYNFDLNRDWAWQTQVESQQRVKLYNQWLPQVHVDFHEQYYNNPYYFAPAAEPFHEVITPWQRTFQTQIGRNNARYFDSNGWLYFTKEYFDLFYPSYGDTYPLYNGSIGMTYEQGGHSRAGLGVLTDNGDTLTLKDRLLHHYTSGLSTIEITAQNAQRVVEEFKKFYDDSRNAKTNDYKTYIVTSDDINKILAVQQLLDKNGITYGTTNGLLKGYSYQTGKEADIKLGKYHLAVSAFQPKSVLARVLFEPQSKLADSATYDITAWSVPFAYGVEGYALKERKDLQPFTTSNTSNQAIATTSYGYLFPYSSLNSARLLAYLLKNNIRVRFAEKPFTYQNKTYAQGTLIVLKNNTSGTEWNDIINKAANLYNIQPDVVSTGFMDKGVDFGSSDIKTVAAPKVAMLTGEGVSSTAAGEVWYLFDQVLDYPITLLNANDLAYASLKNYTVLILPDGYYRSLNNKDGKDKLKEFLQSGGKIIALENAVAQLSGSDFGFKLKEDKEETKEKTDDYTALKKYGDRQRDNLPNSNPGAVYKVEVDNTHPLAFGYGNYYYTLKYDTNIYEFLKDGWNVGYFKKDNYVTGFTGYKAKSKLKDGTLFGSVEIGGGNMVFFADDPLFRMFWENGKLMFCNAVFLVGR